MFRTEIPFAPHPQQLSLSARMLTVGSCFSDVIGARLSNAKVQTLVNPFGTVFNPLSACKLLRAAAGEETDWQQHLVEARGRWQSYDLHASIGAESPVVLLQRVQELVQQTGDFLRTADVVVLTLGSAFAYRLLETQELVSNCHKIPAERFEKELLTPDEIINAVAETHAFLRLRNPKLRFVLTVSPVRHLKDTLPLNAVSKSVLRVACHYLSELLTDVTYFPSYELLLDDLRDYRFYAADMLHPSEVAEDYIWERFARTYFDADFGRFRKEWEAVRQALAHRPLHPAAPEHRQFLENTLARLQRLAEQTDVKAEIREVEKQLRALPLPKPVAVAEPEIEEDEESVDAEPVLEEADEQSSASSAALPPDVVAAEAIAEQTEATQEAEITDASPAIPTKKKRRSRGSAKRSARKKAAQLAALATAASADVTLVQAAEPVPEEASPEEAEEVAAPVELPAAPQPGAEEAPVPPTAEQNDSPTLVADNAEAPTSDEPAAAASKVRKGRTAGQILKAKSGRKSAKAATTKGAKATASTARTTRRKAPAEAVSPPETPVVPPTLPEPAAPKPAEEVTTPKAAATKGRGRPPRKKAGSTDEPTSTT